MAALILFLLSLISPLLAGLNEVLSSPSSCCKSLTGSTEDTLERMIKASRSWIKSLSCTEMTTGDSKFVTSVPSPPTTVKFSLKVTGVSKVVTRPPITSFSSPSSARVALSIKVSSPVIALILLLPMYRSP